jgi:hypothetical protein
MKPDRTARISRAPLRVRGLIGVLALLCAACGTSDADRIDDFVKAVTGEVSAERIDQALASYVDLDLQPLDVSVLGDPRGYASEQRAKLAHDAHARLGFLFGKRLNVLRKRIEIRPPSAHVELQLLGREGMGNVRFTLAKHAERWLIAKVYIGP